MATDNQPDQSAQPEQGPSGSRWEPTDPEPNPPAGEPAATADTPAAGESKPWRERRFVGIPVAAAVAAGLVVASGVGGYALGAATSGDDLSPVGSLVRDRDGFPGFPGDDDHDWDDDGDGDWHRFPGPPDDDGGLPPDLDDDGSGGSDEDSGATT